MSLSQELLEIILDDLDADGDTLSLRMCSLVSASLCHSSQARIFRRVTLAPWVTNNNTMCFLFHRLVTHSPHITRYVRILVLQDRALYTRLSTMEMPTWMIREPTLPPLLRMLPNLEGFHFHAQSFRWTSPWSNAPLSSAIFDALTSSKISSIHFRGLSIPASCILKSSGLRRLLLNDLAVLENGNIDEQHPVERRIRHLGLSGKTLTWFPRAKHHFDIENLVKFRACPEIEVHQYAAVQSLLDACSRSLLEFEYLPFLEYGGVFPHHDLDLSRLSSLRSFVVFSPTARSGNQPVDDPVLWLARVLETLPSDSNIQSITIYLQVVPSHRTEGWAALDASLARPALRTTQVTIFPHSTFYATSFPLDFTGLTPAFNTLLPALNFTGRMHIDGTHILFDSLRFADL
ncbi:hypothetical protein B0H17DRAFT_1327592 [Mycena rosella]|uniref:Uncharacterized protein n=1 Tax=Mycena rosella TaxID=1033263 RepID=A0AAD7GM28_MYCRO|nr:hypothetical protein B0H17DRAFT_1327592 [Mycena rosella]